MKRIETTLPGVLLLEARVFGDNRGYFMESYNERTFADLGIRDRFVQDNHSYSTKGVIRGLHYQLPPQAQGKVIRVAAGEIMDIAVDLRRSSPTFGKWEFFRLSDENRHMLWIPAGLAHGFRVISKSAHVLYKATAFYAPEHERTILWNDPDLKIDWQLEGEPIISDKDLRGIPFRDAPKFD